MLVDNAALPQAVPHKQNKMVVRDCFPTWDRKKTNRIEGDVEFFLKCPLENVPEQKNVVAKLKQCSIVSGCLHGRQFSDQEANIPLSLSHGFTGKVFVCILTKNALLMVAHVACALAVKHPDQGSQ